MLEFRIQSTPNPNARKYVIDKHLKVEGKVSYQDIKDCSHIPIAESLLLINGVTQIHFFENVLTVTQDGSIEWPLIDKAVQDILEEGINEHDPNFIEAKEKTRQVKIESTDPEIQKIDAILDEEIRPALQADGGDIEVISLKENILTLNYLGACGGCPSSMTGTLYAIKAALHSRYRLDLEVVVV